ncbi:tetratricopeptide repeat protein [Dechloromonas sp.]|uniref:tetratricopeptide repeat protein n=1 Tax=Dechloromonas sp. TaxID=1917218 RepID=UPI00286D6A6E|nr:tetratricopeptide repeat protein [Dechloromonas sp.]
MRLISLLLFLCATTVGQAEPEPTIRICDDTGCSDRPRSTTTFNPNADVNPEAERRLAALKEKAEKDPRAAYDLGLRYFRGDGVRQDSYQALQWMRDAAERGDRKAQTAVGKLYLMGLEEMGSDPAEAEKWLSIAAGRGDKEAKKLLTQASTAKKDEVAYRRWVDTQRQYLREYWQSRYTYRWYWNNNGWYYRDDY